MWLVASALTHLPTGSSTYYVAPESAAGISKLSAASEAMSWSVYSGNMQGSKGIVIITHQQLPAS